MDNEKLTEKLREYEARVQELHAEVDKSAAMHNKLLGRLEEARELLMKAFKNHCESKDAAVMDDRVEEAMAEAKSEVA